jgi:hypothetical protein
MRHKLTEQELLENKEISKELADKANVSARLRQKKAYETLTGKKHFKQVFIIILAIISTVTVLIISNVFHYNINFQQNRQLAAKLELLEESNASRAPLIYKDRDSDRIFRDYKNLDAEFKRIFTFMTLEDMYRAKTEAKAFGLSDTTVNMLYDPGEVLTEDILMGSETAKKVNCFYSKSDTFLIDTGDDYYRYLSRISLDVLADHNIMLMLFLDVDKSGKVIYDVCHISSLPSSQVF